MDVFQSALALIRSAWTLAQSVSTPLIITCDCCDLVPMSWQLKLRLRTISYREMEWGKEIAVKEEKSLKNGKEQKWNGVKINTCCYFPSNLSLSFFLLDSWSEFKKPLDKCKMSAQPERWKYSLFIGFCMWLHTLWSWPTVSEQIITLATFYSWLLATLPNCFFPSMSK